MAAAGAMVGCGGDNNPVTGTDGGDGGTVDSSVGMDSGMPDTFMGMDTSMPPPDTGPGPDTGPDAPLPPACPKPTITPATSTIMGPGTNFVITASGLPMGGYIFYTTDGTLPSRTSPVYNAGSVGVPITMTETVRAISSDLGVTCSDSPYAEADYTYVAPPPPDAGPGTPPQAPSFTPTQTTQNNDFTVQISDATAGAIICYTLGTTAPSCSTTATTALCDMGSSTYTSPIAVSPTVTTGGSVEIQALACVPGAAASTVTKTQYTLQVATPSITPAPGNVTWSSTLMGTLTTATSGATIYYTSNGMQPSCGTPVTGQQTYSGPFALQSATYWAIACETGFVDSAAAGPFAYMVGLNPPTISPAAGTFNTALNLSVGNSANPSSSWVCASTSANGTTNATPACGPTAGACSTGTSNIGSLNVVNGNQVQAIACATSLTASAVTTQGPYVLDLAPPVITATPNPLTGAHPSTLTLAMAASPDVQGGWMCWQQNPAVGQNPTCGSTANSCSVGTSSTASMPAAANFSAGDTLAAVTCPGSAAVTGAGYAASSVASFVFSGAGQALSPVISATDATGDTANPWFSQVNAELTNPNSAAMTVCYSTNGTAPACTNGSCTSGTSATVDGLSTQRMTINVTPPGGSGYVNAPWVSLSGGGGTCGIPTATVSGGAVTGIAVSGCTGFTSPPTVTITPGSGATASATLSETLSFTVTNGGSGYAHAPKVNLTPVSGGSAGSCTTTTATLGSGATAGTVVSVSASGCSGFDRAPLVTFNNTGSGGSGAAATSTLSQTLSFAVGGGGGAFYTIAPAVTLTGGGGTCTTAPAATLTATPDPVTGFSVASIAASGCSGFSSAPTVAIAAQQSSTGTAASATAVPGNSVQVAAIQTNPTSLQALACNSGLTASPVVSATYQTAMANPTIVAKTASGSVIAGNPATVDASDTITISTASNFAGETLVYTTDGVTTPNCTGTGTSFTGASTTIAPPAPGASMTVNVIACGAQGQTASTLVTRNFNAVIAVPTITFAANNVTLTPSGGSVTAENLVTATIASATTNSWVCYESGTSIAAAPTCGATANTCGMGSTLSTGTVSITKSATELQAIACATESGTVTASASATTLYTVTLDVTPIVASVTTAACPATVTIGLSNTTTDQQKGGPTTGATICYSLSSEGATGVPSSCTAGFQGGVQVHCVPPNTFSITATETVYALACAPGLISSSGTFATGVTAYSEPTINVDGVMASSEWSSTLGDVFNTSTTGVQGGFTFGNTGTTMYFAQGGITSSSTTDVVLYLADVGPGSTTTDTSTTGLSAANSNPVLELGGGTLPFAAGYAIVINTTSASGTTCAASACVTNYKFDHATGKWQAALGPAITDVTAVVTANALEASIPTVHISGSGVIDLAGALVTGAGTAGATLTGAWPQTTSNLWGFVSDTTSTCLAPDLTIQ